MTSQVLMDIEAMEVSHSDPDAKIVDSDGRNGYFVKPLYTLYFQYSRGNNRKETTTKPRGIDLYHVIVINYVTAKDAVVSHCGHLFCRPCLVQWLDTRPYRQVSPVCKALTSRDKEITLYGRGGNETELLYKVPARPLAQRQEAPQFFLLTQNRYEIGSIAHVFNGSSSGCTQSRFSTSSRGNYYF